MCRFLNTKWGYDINLLSSILVCSPVKRIEPCLGRLGCSAGLYKRVGVLVLYSIVIFLHHKIFSQMCHFIKKGRNSWLSRVTFHKGTPTLDIRRRVFVRGCKNNQCILIIFIFCPMQCRGCILNVSFNLCFVLSVNLLFVLSANLFFVFECKCECQTTFSMQVSLSIFIYYFHVIWIVIVKK